jgi:plastocyanin
MKSALALVGIAAFVTIGAAASRSAGVPANVQVMVHCPAGPNAAFVTPQRVRVSVGDSVQWKMTGDVAADSLVISLKDPAAAWPFTGPIPAGRDGASTGRASTAGTYSYAVTLECRQAGGGTRHVVIDPDIIIE